MECQTILRDMIELEAQLEQVECCLQALREPLQGMSQAIAELRPKTNASDVRSPYGHVADPIALPRLSRKRLTSLALARSSEEMRARIGPKKRP